MRSADVPLYLGLVLYRCVSNGLTAPMRRYTQWRNKRSAIQACETGVELGLAHF